MGFFVVYKPVPTLKMIQALEEAQFPYAINYLFF